MRTWAVVMAHEETVKRKSAVAGGFKEIVGQR